jgi:hypothetical protein
MLNYRFAVHDSNGGSEDLGGMTLVDDGEAIAFGKGMIRDLTREDAEQYAGWIMDITEGERTVACIRIDAGRAGKAGA